MRKLIAWSVLIFILFFVIRGWWNSQFAPASMDSTPQTFVIKKGESVNSVSERLEHQGLIRSKLAFKVALKLQKDSPHVQAGDFKLSPSMSIDKIIIALGKGVFESRVTLQEGLRIEQMAQKLNQALGIDEKEFTNLATEGYMFPDTYSFDSEATASDVVSVMKKTFNQKFTGDLQEKIRKRGLTLAQGVILASIVEREARSAEVRTKVAGILLKRYKIGMGLNADATIQYILGYQLQEKSWWKRSLSSEDLKEVSPYNTYLHVGLPPAPICNPGLSSLQAVANADSSTPYLYYYHDSKGNSYYSKTLEEHNQNVANHP